MATLRKQVTMGTVQVFRGVADFYLWKGVPVCRRWPVWNKKPPTGNWPVTWDALRNMFAWKARQPEQWQNGWKNTSAPKGLSYEDLKRKSGLKLAYANSLINSPVISQVEIEPHPALERTFIYFYVSNWQDFFQGDVTFMVRPYTGKKPPLDWIPTPFATNRYGLSRFKYSCDTLPYQEPVTTTWQNGPKRYKVRYDFMNGPVAFFATPTNPTGNGLMLGPVLYSPDFP